MLWSNSGFHSGHIFFLKEAKKLGDTLTIVLTHDENNNKSYAIPTIERKKKLESLNIADKIIIGDACDKIKIVRELKPDVIVLGYDQILPEGLTDFCHIHLKRRGKYSTKDLFL